MTHVPPRTPPPPAPSSGSESQAALRAQILGVEHWSLLATRSMIWQEIFSRTGTFLTVLSASMVALSLVVQAAGFGSEFRTVALLVLPLVLLVGFTTYIRLLEADIEDMWIVVGMNRLRRAYVEMVPDVERFFVTGSYDDEPHLLQTYSFRRRIGATHLLSGSPMIVGLINAMISGVFVTIVCQALGGPRWLQIALGVSVASGTAVTLSTVFIRRVNRFRRAYVPKFPRPGPGE